MIDGLEEAKSLIEQTVNPFRLARCRPAQLRNALLRLPTLGQAVPRFLAVREPDAGDLHVRFDERDVETELRRGY